MTTLRERAREYAKSDVTWDYYGVSNTGHHRMAGADAASEMWEELLRKLLDAMDELEDSVQLGFMSESRQSRINAAVAEAREALG